MEGRERALLDKNEKECADIQERMQSTLQETKSMYDIRLAEEVRKNKASQAILNEVESSRSHLSDTGTELRRQRRNVEHKEQLMKQEESRLKQERDALAELERLVAKMQAETVFGAAGT